MHRDPEDLHSPLDPTAVAEAVARAHEEDPIRIKQYNVELEEDGTRIAMTVVDTPGFGEGIDNEYWLVSFRVREREKLTGQFPRDLNLPREAI